MELSIRVGDFKAPRDANHKHIVHPRQSCSQAALTSFMSLDIYSPYRTESVYFEDHVGPFSNPTVVTLFAQRQQLLPLPIRAYQPF